MMLISLLNKYLHIWHKDLAILNICARTMYCITSIMHKTAAYVTEKSLNQSLG